MLKVFITNLGKYNEGYLLGEWVELPVSEEDLKAVYERIGINHYYEETFITDYESDIPGVQIDEWDNIEKLNELAEKLEDLTEDRKLIIQGCLENGDTLEEALKR